jgi:biopolymer transport protein ExbD
MKLLDDKPKKVTLNITSLVDVLFILIIFFTISSTFLEQPGLKLELPKAQSSETQKVDKAVLYIDESANLFFMNQPVTLDNLGEKLKSAMGTNVNKSLIISADKSVHHGLVVQVMDIARSNGVEKLVISTTPKK